MPQMLDQISSSLIHPVYEAVKQMIHSGELEPGEKIVQEKMALKLGISRTPLVKALHLLEQELLVENLPRRGMYVRRISDTDLIDAFECRLAIEAAAARQAADRMTNDELEALSRLFAPYENATNIDIRKYQETDMTFHRSIIIGSRNKYLEKMIELTNVHIKTYQRGLVRPPEETLSEHKQIAGALTRRDAEKAEQAAKEHLRKSIENLKSNLKA